MEFIISFIVFILFIVWAIRIETNLNKTVNHLKNIEALLERNSKEKK